MRKNLVSLVIVNYNGRHFLAECLNSIYVQTYKSFEVIFVDNASTDDSIEFVENNFKDVLIIEQNKNLGFAIGNNIAIRQAHGEYIATINNDACLDKEWLQELVSAIKYNSIGICSSKILFYHNHSMINSTGICVDKITGFTWDRDFGNKSIYNNAPSYVFGACAAAALYKKNMLDEIGLFDEDFVSYHEDVDLAWRAQLSGWKCKYVPTAIAYHHLSATAGLFSPYKEYLANRNKIWLILKNYPSPEIYKYSISIFCVLLGYFIYSLIKGNRYAIKGKLDALIEFKKFFRKRLNVQKNKKVNFIELSQTWENNGLVQSFINFRRFGKTLEYVIAEKKASLIRSLRQAGCCQRYPGAALRG